MTFPARENGPAPNLERLLAKSPAALEGVAALRAALQGGMLTPRLRAAIALFVSEANGCGYCLSRNVERARAAGLDEAEITGARQGRSSDESLRAVLTFVEGLVYAHGSVSDAEAQRLRDAGFDEGAVVEIVAVVVLTLAENYFALAGRLAPEGERVRPLYDDGSSGAGGNESAADVHVQRA